MQAAVMAVDGDSFSCPNSSESNQRQLCRCEVQIADRRDCGFGSSGAGVLMRCSQLTRRTTCPGSHDRRDVDAVGAAADTAGVLVRVCCCYCCSQVSGPLLLPCAACLLLWHDLDAASYCLTAARPALSGQLAQNCVGVCVEQVGRWCTQAG